MSPIVSTILSTIFLAAGAVAVYTMIAIQGLSKVSNARHFVRLHKLVGWLFVALFLVMFSFMLLRIEDFWEESAPRIAIHVALSVALLFFLALKVLIARYFKRLAKNLFLLGTFVYGIGFTLVGISGGYYIARLFQKTPYISHSELDEHLFDERLGKEFFITRCSLCHSLDRIMDFRGIDSWEKVINEMVEIAEPRIKPDEAKQILHYLSKTHVPKPYEGPTDASPVQKYCLPCHVPSEIYEKKYSRTGWMEVVRQMNGYSPEIVPDDEMEAIVHYLLEQQGE